MAEEQVAELPVVEEVEHRPEGLGIVDGFRFGCGFTLAFVIGLLTLLVLATGFAAVGMLLGLRLPFGG